MAHRSSATGRFISNAAWGRWYAEGSPLERHGKSSARSLAAKKGWKTRRRNEAEKKKPPPGPGPGPEPPIGDEDDYYDIDEGQEPEEFEASGQYEKD